MFPANPTDSLKNLFLRTQHVDMTDLENLAQLLMKWVDNFPELQIGISTFESTMSTLQIGVNTYIGITVNDVFDHCGSYYSYRYNRCSQ